MRHSQLTSAQCLALLTCWEVSTKESYTCGLLKSSSTTLRKLVFLLEKMFPVLFRVLRAYAPYITLPFAAVVGIIGYNLENIMSDKYTPYQESIQKKRGDRLLETEDASSIGSLKEKKFVPDTVFEKNLSPSLQQPKEK